jgi:hypothetical protein
MNWTGESRRCSRSRRETERWHAGLSAILCSPSRDGFHHGSHPCCLVAQPPRCSEDENGIRLFSLPPSISRLLQTIINDNSTPFRSTRCGANWSSWQTEFTVVRSGLGAMAMRPEIEEMPPPSARTSCLDCSRSEMAPSESRGRLVLRTRCIGQACFGGVSATTWVMCIHVGDGQRDSLEASHVPSF